MRIIIGKKFREYLKSNNYNQVFLTEGIGVAGFLADEFASPLTIAGLLQELEKAGIGVEDGKDDIQRLNNVLSCQGFYKSFPKIKLGAKAKELLNREASLSPSSLRQLNRLIIEKAYPGKCPKSQGMSYPSKCIFIFSKREWDRINAKFAKVFGSEKMLAEKFFDMFNKNVITINLEKTRYIDIPKKLQKKAGIKQDVFVVGKENRIEIWAKNKRYPVLSNNYVVLSQ